MATPALTIAALGFATLVLGVVCWLLGKSERGAVANDMSGER